MSVVIPSLRGAIAVPGWAKNELWRKARAVPSLDLRFADSKSLVDATTGSNLVTFTRASSGTFVGSDGVLQTATSDVPRFDHNPTTGESLGLLVEEQRTNLLVRSEEFDNASWTKSGGSISANSVASPSGATTADTFAESAVTEAHFLTGISSSAAASTTYTFSFFAKSNGRNLVGAWVRGLSSSDRVDVQFNLSTGAVVSGPTSRGTFTGAAASIQSLPGGWFRCTLTGTSGASETSIRVLISTDTSVGTIAGSYTGDGTSGIYLWGAQLEAGAFSTSYIPTTAATVTRSADVASISGSNFSAWYRQDEGTFFGDAQTPFAVTGFPVIADGRVSSTDIVQIGFVTESLSVGYVKAANADEAVMYNTGLSGVRRRRVACGMAVDSFAVSTNGGSLVTDSSGSMPTNIASIFIGSTNGSSAVLNGTIRRLCFWPRRLGNEVLQGITQ